MCNFGNKYIFLSQREKVTCIHSDGENIMYNFAGMWLCNVFKKPYKTPFLQFSNHTYRNEISGKTNKGRQKFMYKDSNLKHVICLSKNWKQPKSQYQKTD
jgi:hypothetical protein